MRLPKSSTICVTLLSAFGAVFAAYFAGCGVAPQPNVIIGPNVEGNNRPTLEITSPTRDLSIGQGQPLLIRWVDSDTDSNATISFRLVNTANNSSVTLVSSLVENDDQGPDEFAASTALVPQAEYNLQGVIDDRQNPPVLVYAQTPPPNPQRVKITVAGEGEAPTTRPPQVNVITPTFDLSVAEQDTLDIIVNPTAFLTGEAYDEDSECTLYILLDTDENPDNDDPANPGSSIIVLDTRQIATGVTDAIGLPVSVSLSEIPPRANGEPYFIRATITDQDNPPVHDYADGTISVVKLAFGEVDLYNAGRTVSGSRFYGFTPSAKLGSRVASVSDFDADGADDFMMIAQFGNPRGVGPVGESYLIYGAPNRRYGGTFPANGTAEAIQGCIFEAPPIRDFWLTTDGATNGITDAGFIPDVSGDGRPELLVGMSLAHGIWQGMDWDPADQHVAGVLEEQVTLRIRQGQVVEVVGGAETVVDTTYSGVDDLIISNCRGSNCTLGDDATSNGQGVELNWNQSTTTGTQWTLLKFKEILQVLADRGDQPGELDIPEVQASLTVNVFRSGDNGSLYQAYAYFDESTTHSTFAKGGGDPVLGVDYASSDDGGTDTPIGSIDAGDIGEVAIDVSEMIQELLQGTLQGSDAGDTTSDPLVDIDELRFLVDAVGELDASPSPGAIRSSEFSTNQSLRPTLAITYTRRIAAASACYPDDLVNNRTNAPPGGPVNDDSYDAGGVAVMINSENRDNDGNIDPNRLWNTAVTLELAGQEPGIVLDPGFTQRAQGRIPGRIDGCRFQNGYYDYIDPFILNQPIRRDLFGSHVASIPDMNLDLQPEIIISSPLNERYLQDLEDEFGIFSSTQWWSTPIKGSIVIFPGADYSLVTGNTGDWADEASNSQIPIREFGACPPPGVRRGLFIPVDTYEIFAEDLDDFLQDGQYAGDINLDNVPDILCGAPLNNRGALIDSGAVYIIEGKNFMGEVDLGDADDPTIRHPMVRIRGAKANDRIGTSQAAGLDVNGDRLDDVFFASPFADYGLARTQDCGQDFNGDDLVDANDFVLTDFNDCVDSVGDDVFTDDACKAFDYNNDSVIDDLDREVFDCLADGGTTCCDTTVDNGYIGVIFGGVTIDGDFELSQVATTDMPGVIFYGAHSLDRAGTDVSSAGDFNRDGYGDLLIVTPGETKMDANSRLRKGLVYLVFGGPHLQNRIFSLEDVGTDRLPGIYFLSPYVAKRPNEAAPETATLLGDINDDGYDDIAIGNPRADFINLNFPQGPNASNEDASVGRRRNTGDVYVIYGNNFGSNRLP
ncbi:MAG: hypothetical protein IT449_11440 [Phycisphaerales bacterium]|nr:hypothetical protein [Phycisphaerales bacterium]